MAGRIPQHFIDDLLARVNIIDVLDGRVQKLKRTGKNFSGLCPFHKEKTPSFTANQEKQFYYCFGCGAGGNALGFMMEYDHLDFPQAVEELAKMAGMEVPREESQQNRQQQQQLKSLYDLLEQASQFYTQQLRSHPAREQAVKYLKSRGLSGQAAKAFDIGFAPPGWDNFLEKVGNDEKNRQLLEQAGLLIHNEERNSDYDRFRNRIMFPIRDQRGRVIAFGGRVLGDDKPKYLNSPETETFHKGRELYGLYEARKHNQKLERLLIVEGYMDVVGLAQYGIHYAIATLGTATSAQHLERVFKMVPEVIFCFDGDQAGRTAAKRALSTTLPVIKDGQEARFLFLPDGEDPDSLVRKEGTEQFSKRLDEGLPLAEFFFKSHSEEMDLNSMDGRARFSSAALPMIHTMKPGILKQMMLDRVSELTGLSQDQLESVVNLHSATQAAPPPQQAPDSFVPDYYDEGDYGDPELLPTYPQPSQQSSKPRRSDTPRSGRGTVQLSERIISLLLHFPTLARLCELPVKLDQLPENNIPLLCALIDYLKSHPRATLGTLYVDWQEDPVLSGYLMTLNGITYADPVNDIQKAEQILRDALPKLESRIDDLRLNELSKKISRSEEEKNELNQLLLKQHLNQAPNPAK
ncbi:DNA primase [Pontibacterium sp. N1Y112]|uniref:DNA primase n=1 Tax=Pontibacterium sinense TaxID=2781979 RepID=A0A8J7K989_9GAMM|nr:DNA primase [Pontibacterium sinense]MBE9396436.1 DNA primase [Pontibacterium sinense]